MNGVSRRPLAEALAHGPALRESPRDYLGDTPLCRYALSTAGNSMTTALRGPLRNHFCKKRGVPSRTEGERILEILRKPQMP